MTTISRINTTISEHTMVTNYIALCLLVFGVIAGTVALHQNGDLTKSYDALFPTTATTGAPVNETPATKVQATPQTSTTKLTVSNSSPRSVQNQPQNIISELQPANDSTYLQPNANGVQLTRNNLQNAEGSNLQ